MPMCVSYSNDYFHRNDLMSDDPEASVVVQKWGQNETVHTYQWLVYIFKFSLSAHAILQVCDTVDQ